LLQRFSDVGACAATPKCRLIGGQRRNDQTIAMNMGMMSR